MIAVVDPVTCGWPDGFVPFHIIDGSTWDLVFSLPRDNSSASRCLRACSHAKHPYSGQTIGCGSALCSALIGCFCFAPVRDRIQEFSGFPQSLRSFVPVHLVRGTSALRFDQLIKWMEGATASRTRTHSDRSCGSALMHLSPQLFFFSLWTDVVAGVLVIHAPKSSSPPGLDSALLGRPGST